MPPDRKPSSQPMIWIALVVTLALVYWQWSQEDNAAAPENILSKPMVTPRTAVAEAKPDRQPLAAETVMSEVTPAAAPGQASTYFTRELPVKKISHSLFAAHEWLPPPPKPQPPLPPQAPPLPYSYVGSMQDVPGGDTVILIQQKKVLLPKVGSQVSTQWRLDREDAQAVYFTYLPLNQPVVLSKTKTVVASERKGNADAENHYPEEILNQ